MIAAGTGFFLGLSPRIVSILIGETSRGGQGHDVDFLPTKLLGHFLDLLTRSGPKVFGFEKIFQGENFSLENTLGLILILIIVPVLLIFFFSLFSFFYDNRKCLKNIITLKKMEFHPIQPILLAPIVVCLANVIVQNGSQPRYLFPLFGLFALWIGVYVEKTKFKLKPFPVIVLFLWTGFYSVSNYQYFQEQGLIKGGKLVKFDRHFIYDLIEFLESNNIMIAYSDYFISSVGTYFSDGNINISEYTDNPIAKTQKANSMMSSDFAILATGEYLKVYKTYLKENGIKFKNRFIANYEIFWDFVGGQSEINHLRSLIPG